MSSTGSTAVQEAQSLACEHCGLRVPAARLDPEADKQFCCAGCEHVYKIINGLGLSQFYALKRQADILPGSPVSPGTSAFSHFADESFAERYVSKRSDGLSEVKFALEGIYCAACVWLVEKLPLVADGVREARVDFGRKTVDVIFDSDQTELPQIARALDSLGYVPRPFNPSQRLRAAREESKQALIRLGIAGACAGNTMMIAVSLYQGYFSGIEPKYQSFLQWASLLVTLPVVFYSAVPFYKRAFGGLRVGSLHIDLPITIGILLGFFASVINTVLGMQHVYYDSICMLVFLLLLGRWLQQRGLERAMDARSVMFALSPTAARRVKGERREEVYVESLEIDDLIEVKAREVLPADGIVKEGQSTLNTSILTGESRPRKVSAGDEVFAGTTNLSGVLLIKVAAVHQESRIGRILSVIERESSQKSPLVQITDRVGAYFVAVVLSLSAATFLYWWLAAGVLTAVDHALALLVVTCPCALGLAAPLSLSAGIHRAASSGILIRGADVIERLAKVRRIFFDKTGTLTKGLVQVKSFATAQNGPPPKVVLQSAAILENSSQHPVGSAIRSFALEQLGASSLDISSTEVEEVHGKGVVSRSGPSSLRMGSVPWLRESLLKADPTFARSVDEMIARGESPVLLEIDGRAVGAFSVGDILRTDASQVLSSLHKKGYQIEILSGDISEAVEKLACELGISPELAHAELSPEQKRDFVLDAQATSRTAMVGDGVNDAAALSSAEVGIGMSSGAEACLDAADVFIARNGFEAFANLFSGAEATMKLIRRNIGLSLVYNILGASGAVLGYVSPLVAAILMPISSLSVVLSTVFSRTFSKEKH